MSKIIKMTSERIKEIQEQTAYPQSVSVMKALKQVWNECEQDSTKYNEEEVRGLLIRFHNEFPNRRDINEWFNKNKKKK